MKNLAIAILTLTLMGTQAGTAADLVIDPVVTAPEAIESHGWYFELLGGAAVPTTVGHNFNGVLNHSHDLLIGPAVAAVLGYEIVDNVSIELDGMVTSRQMSGLAAHHTTASLMAGVRYTLDIADGFSVYAGAGAGIIGFHDNSFVPAGGSAGLGYQLKVGTTAALTENVSVVGELRYQAPFGQLDVSGHPGNSATFHTPAVMAGFKVGF